MQRTSLSLIGFGFTIFNFFNSLSTRFLEGQFPREAAKNVGMAMVVLGILILAFGIFDHYRQMQGLRARKKRLVELGLAHAELPLSVASSMAIAILLLLIGLFAIGNIASSVFSA
jgi:putative membrane protein